MGPETDEEGAKPHDSAGDQTAGEAKPAAEEGPAKQAAGVSHRDVTARERARSIAALQHHFDAEIAKRDAVISELLGAAQKQGWCKKVRMPE